PVTGSKRPLPSTMWEMSLAPPGGTGVLAMTPMMGAARRPAGESSPHSRAVAAMAYRRVESDLDRIIFGHLANARPHDLYWENPPSAFQRIFFTVILAPQACGR